MFYCNCFEQAPPAPTLGDVNVLLFSVVKRNEVVLRDNLISLMVNISIFQFLISKNRILLHCFIHTGANLCNDFLIVHVRKNSFNHFGNFNH